MAKQKKSWKVTLERESVEYATVYVDAATKKEAIELAEQEQQPNWSKEQVQFCGATGAKAVKDGG